MRRVAVTANTSGDTTPKARTANRTGSAKPSILAEPSVRRYTNQAATRPTAVAIMRLPDATSSRVWQCGHSIPFESAITSVAGTVLPQCGQIRIATLHLAEAPKISQMNPEGKAGIMWPEQIPRGDASGRSDRRARARDRQASKRVYARPGRKRWRDLVRGRDNVLRSPLRGD